MNEPLGTAIRLLRPPTLGPNQVTHHELHDLLVLGSSRQLKHARLGPLGKPQGLEFIARPRSDVGPVDAGAFPQAVVGLDGPVVRVASGERRHDLGGGLVYAPDDLLLEVDVLDGLHPLGSQGHGQLGRDGLDRTLGTEEGRPFGHDDPVELLHELTDRLASVVLQRQVLVPGEKERNTLDKATQDPWTTDTKMAKSRACYLKRPYHKEDRHL